jgi:hypothetical protein
MELLHKEYMQYFQQCINVRRRRTKHNAEEGDKNTIKILFHPLVMKNTKMHEQLFYLLHSIPASASILN